MFLGSLPNSNNKLVYEALTEIPTTPECPMLGLILHQVHPQYGFKTSIVLSIVLPELTIVLMMVSELLTAHVTKWLLFPVLQVSASSLIQYINTCTYLYTCTCRWCSEASIDIIFFNHQSWRRLWPSGVLLQWRVGNCLQWWIWSDRSWCGLSTTRL